MCRRPNQESITEAGDALIDFCHLVIDIPTLIEETSQTKGRGDLGIMPYERTRQIEKRFQQAVCLIKKEPLNARELAAALEVSTSTVQRIITELRRRGHSIRSVRESSGWRYELLDHHSLQIEEVSP